MGVAHPTETGVEPGIAAAVSRLTVVPQRRYGIWIGTALALLLAFLIVRAFASNPAFAWGTAAGYLFHPSIMRGLGNTLVLTVIIMLLAIVVAQSSPSCGCRRARCCAPFPASMSGFSAACRH